MNNDGRPPLFGSWPKAYWIAFGFFVLEVALFYVFTLRFS
jgi:hypothetical protein